MAMFCLASTSPRRKALLEQIGASFITRPVDIPENVDPGEAPEHYVKRLALSKAKVGYNQLPDHEKLPTLGSDTTVVSVSGDILCKPSSKDDAVDMLKQLSGTEHRVLTAVAMVLGHEEKVILSESWVTFRHLPYDEIIAYVETEEPLDKAGAYGIQGVGAIMVSSIRGSYSGVVGLPLAETYELIKLFGIDILQGETSDKLSPLGGV